LYFSVAIARVRASACKQLTQFDGLSLNQFITLAVTEKIVRMEIFNPYIEDFTSKLSKSRISRH
jgi:hypothetical protein